MLYVDYVVSVLYGSDCLHDFQVLQILVFNNLFYKLVDGVGKRVGHSFKDETPLLDAM
jgi:hypothetical protein